MLALGLLLLGQSLLAGFGPDFVELLEILPDLDFGLFLFLDTKIFFPGK